MLGRIIVGLGNPGSRYELTRHNVGFLVIDRLAEMSGARMMNKRAQALTGEAVIGQTRVLLVKPQTYMNLSGLAVRSLMDWYKLSPAEVIVVYDDLDLPPGRLRIRADGGAAGHRGMTSVIQKLGTEEIARVRVGIGRPAPHLEAADYVLSSLQSEEMLLLRNTVDRAADAVACLVQDGIEKCMNQYNKDA